MAQRVCDGDALTAAHAVHGANGYLVHQFLENHSNVRTDQWGGSAEKRSRFGLRVVEAVAAAIGETRTAIRLSPFTTFQGMKMAPGDILETYSYFVTQLKSRFPKLAYLHVIEPRISGAETVECSKADSLDFVADIWRPSPLLVAGGFKANDASAVTSRYENAVIVYGRYFLSTPDLVARLKHNIAFNPYNRDTFYLTDDEPRGYIDYPFAAAA